MRSRVVRQAISRDSLFHVIVDWCKNGAGQKNCKLRFLSAFASGGGVGAIVPLLDVFLSDGNSVEIIIGIDRQGTDKGALRHLGALIDAYPTQCDVAVFNAPARAAIFHPKLYIYDRGGFRSFVVGSPNLTAGGLGSNFESMILYHNCQINLAPAKHADELWNLFAEPVLPLRPEYLKPLTKKYLRELLRKLPDKPTEKEKSEGDTFRELWKPLSRIPLPRSTRPELRTQLKTDVHARRYLVMDVLSETRSTQMQVPVPVVEGFFGIEKHQPADLALSIVTKSGLSQPIERTLVISQGSEGRRLMRRIEMPQIRSLERPLAVVFVKLSGRRRFAFRLLPQGSTAMRSAERLLARFGQQGGARRRYIFGTSDDSHWQAVKRLTNL